MSYLLENKAKIYEKSTNIPVDYAPMQDLSINIKTMPQAFRGYHLLLVITCDQTNFMIAIPVKHREYCNLLLARAQLVGNMLLEWRTKQALEYESKTKKF